MTHNTTMYLLGLVLPFLLFVLILLRPRFQASQRYGSATLVRRSHLFHRKHQGLVIDGRNRLSAQHSFQHLMCVSPTGTGKSQGFVLPNLLTLDTSMVVTDIKGELYELTAAYLHRKGFQVRCIDFGNPTTSLHYNPLHRLKDDLAIKSFARQLITMSSKKASEGIWTEGSIQVLEVIIRLLKNKDGGHYANLANIQHVLNYFSGTPDELRLLDQWVICSADEAIKQQYKRFMNQESKIRAGQLSGALAAMVAFDSSDIHNLTQKDELNFAELRHQKTVLFLKVPISKATQMSPLITLFYTQFFDYLLSSEISPVDESIFVLLEEAGNLQRIPNLAAVTSLVRSRRVSVSLVLQNIDQLDRIYGREDAQTIQSNTAGLLVYPGLKSERTLRSVLTLLGVTTHEEKDELGRTQHNARAVLTLDELRRLPTGRGVFIHSNAPAVDLRITPLYANKKLLRHARIRSHQGRLQALQTFYSPQRSSSSIDFLPLQKKLASTNPYPLFEHINTQ
ncbi:MAG: type IV secretory system conjugative DNA transfer family protein [Bacteroidota bacterium]